MSVPTVEPRFVPVVPVVLELASSLPGADRDVPREACRLAVAATIDQLLETLGIPGRVTVEVVVGKGLTPDRPLRLTINDVQCSYPDELPHWTASYVSGSHVQPNAAAADVLADLRGDTEWKEAGADRTLADFVALTCLEIAKVDLALLLALPQVEAYAAIIAPLARRGTCGRARPPSAAWLLMILKRVITQRISLGDHQLLATLLAEADNGDDSGTLIESLIAGMRAGAVEVQLSRDVWESVINSDPKSVNERFAFLRDGLFVETGVDYAPFRVAIAEELHPGSFAFKVGCLRTMPMVGLRSDELLVNDTAERLKHVHAQPVMNPATAQPASIVTVNARERLDPSLTTWDAHGHLILCMAAALRRLGSCFVDRSLAANRLRFAQLIFPTLASAIAEQGYTAAQLARVLRGLVAEGISIRNVRLIFDKLVENAFARRDEHRILELVRAGLCRSIRHKFARGTDTVVVYLLDPQIEGQLAAQRWRRRPERTLCEAILASVRAEIQQLHRIAPTAWVPSILTTSQVRSTVRGVLAGEFPRVEVISYDDLPSDTNIQPIARISLAHVSLIGAMGES
jgi:FHIPEP family